jgi:hypothetical protein
MLPVTDYLKLVTGNFFLIIAKQFNCLKKQTFILFLCILFFVPAFSQTAQFSLATDVSLLRSFKKEQRYWAIGQTVAGHFNFAPKNGMYVWLAYYSNGKFSNHPSATAKSPLTLPHQIDYTNDAQMRIKHISVGWKHYLKGAYNMEDKWSLYGYAGFGLLFGSIENQHSVSIDSAEYYIPVLQGKANFKRLTLDLGLGYEIPLGGDIYFYMEGRAFLPTTDYPSNYLFVNKKAPLTGSLNTGLRILFD